LMLEQISLLAERGLDFGFETTLSGRSHISFIRQLRNRGYRAHLFFLWLPSVDLALSRIRGRVLAGGHDVPEAVIRRRFDRSTRSFFRVYRLLAESWMLFDNSAESPAVVALEEQRKLRIIKAEAYEHLVETYGKL
jgi:predicted ABC-type ATPase